MILPVFITVMADHDKPQPSGCLLDPAISSFILIMEDQCAVVRY
ncbi:TPA: hemolysin activation protein [Escherichia coli]|nr:hemolysin activation protein [Escherichia coli]HBA8276252.1 hemolysin activation protein [Escherichia coli]